MKRMSTTYPFIEIFCDPLNDYRVSWNWPHTLEMNEQALLSRYFKNKRFINDEALLDFLSFFEEAEELPRIHIRPEVREKVEQAYERKLLADIGSRVSLSFDNIKANLYDYQKEGVRFVTFKKEAIIADEMGLGKTLQALTTAIKKKEIFGFTRTLIVCPASLKQQWKREIEHFSSEKALVVQGPPDEREKQYKTAKEHFIIVNYETILRDNNIGFVELNGKIPVKSRSELIHKFETNEQCKIFLSTEAGGSGLNLQVADTLINFELPWNPAKKNQRIGRIDRLGQKSSQLTIFNFITYNSIEQHIAAGLLVKQSLFNSVLGANVRNNFVDFSSKGRSQFIEQLEEFIATQETMPDTHFNNEEVLVAEPESTIKNNKSSEEIDLSEEIGTTTESAPLESPGTESPQTAEIEQVMNSACSFSPDFLK